MLVAQLVELNCQLLDSFDKRVGSKHSVTRGITVRHRLAIISVSRVYYYTERIR